MFRTMLIPEAAICRANSLPIPDEAPVTSAHGRTSLCRVLLSISLLRFCLLRACCDINYSAANRRGFISQSTDSVLGCNSGFLCQPGSLGCCRAVFRIKRWASSIHSVNAAGLRPQDCAFVGLCNFPSFDRNHAVKERTHTRYGFF